MVVWQGYCGTGGKPVSKQRKQTRAYAARETGLLDKLWVDEWQSHFESIFGKQAALSRRAVGLHGL